MKKRIKTNAQAALEFLMSYAWAIMVLLIAIGALVYFGVLSSSKFLPSSCIVEPGIACVDFKVVQNSVTLILRNGKGEDINITSINVEKCQGSDSGFLKNGELATFNIGNCNFEANKKIVLVVNLTYISSTGLVHKKVGKITDIVELGIINVSNVTNVTLSTDLVAYWKLNESSGTRFDSKGNNHLNDPGNNVTSISGKIGNAANFTNSRNQHLNISDNLALSMGDINFTIACWVYFDSLADDRFILTKSASLSAANPGGEYSLEFDAGGNGKLQFAVRNTADNAGTIITTTGGFGTPNIKIWYLIVGWHDSANDEIAIQINNGIVNKTVHTGGVKDANNNFLIGAASHLDLGPTRGMDGRIDECGIWKKVLTVQERAYLYNNGNGYTFNP